MCLLMRVSAAGGCCHLLNGMILYASRLHIFLVNKRQLLQDFVPLAPVFCIASLMVSYFGFLLLIFNTSLMFVCRSSLQDTRTQD